MGHTWQQLFGFGCWSSLSALWGAALLADCERQGSVLIHPPTGVDKKKVSLKLEKATFRFALFTVVQLLVQGQILTTWLTDQRLIHAAFTHLFQTIQPSLHTNVHASFTLAWMSSRTATTGRCPSFSLPSSTSLLILSNLLPAVLFGRSNIQMFKTSPQEVQPFF